VSDDATLDSFAGRDDDAAEPVPVTSAWTPDGACPACGGTAGRRWRNDGEFVCADCANWETGTSACDQ
jgi:hypothetical protein